MLPPAVPDFVPVQLPPKVAFDKVTSVGKVSTRALLRVADDALLFDSVMVSVLVPPGAMVDGLNDLATVGGVVTVRFASADTVLLPRLVCSAPGAMVLVYPPGVLEVTLTLIVHPPAGMVLPDA